MNKIKFDSSKYVKLNPNIKIISNAIAQGYSVDIVADFFNKKGIQNYLVEIGGEIKAKGLNSKDSLWSIGIDLPLDSAEHGDLYKKIHLSNKAIATSGNYRKFYYKDGKKYSHIINPLSGYPVESDILSASVITEDCIVADALATSFIVMGLNKSIAFCESHSDIEVILIYRDINGKIQSYSNCNY